MRTLAQVVDAVREQNGTSYAELEHAVVAFDVVLGGLLSDSRTSLVTQHYIVEAYERSVADLGVNSLDSAQGWFNAMNSMIDELYLSAVDSP